MSNYTTNATVNLQMNGKEPQQVLADLRQRAFDLQNAIAKAAAEGKKTDLSKLRKELKTTQREIREMESATQEVAEVMKRLDKASPKELQKSLRTLEKQLGSIERGTEAWEEQTKQIRMVRAEIDKVNKELREGEGFWERFNRKMNDWQTTIAAGAAAVTGLVMAGRSAVKAYADMDAEMANVRKYTGMTAEEVLALNEEMKKMDTRSSREQLNGLAQEAGRLGKSSHEDVMGFVRAADQINVALDDLGEGATLTLSKLTNIFGDEERLGTEKALLSVGSVINELSQNCTASAPYLAQFAQRLAGVGAQADMTIPQIMGYAAVLDSQGQAVEMSATALSKLIMDLFKDTEKIAKATGMNVNQLNEALSRSTNEGLLMLLERLKQLGGMDVLAPIFKDMGAEGARASAVISTLAGNIDMVKSQQEVANRAFEEATSVTKEFNVQNTTIQAELDKARKRVSELAIELGEKLRPVMSHVISSTTLLLRMLSVMVDFIIRHKTAIVSVTAAVVAYTIAVNASNIAFKAQYYWLVLTNAAHKAGAAIQATYRTAVLLCSVAVNKLTGNTTRAAAAQRLLNTAQKANLYALIIGLVVGLAVAIYKLLTAETQMQKREKELASIRQAAASKVAEERTEIDLLVKAQNNELLSMEEREKAVKRLNEIIPGYNGQLDKTTGKYVANKKALDEYIKSLVKKYEVEGARTKLEELGGEIADLRIQRSQAQEEYDKAKNAPVEHPASNWVGGREGAIMRGGEAVAHVTNVNSAKNKLDKIDAQIAEKEGVVSAITNTYGTDLQKQAVNNPTTDTTTPTVFPTTTEEYKDKFAKEKEWRTQQEALNRIAYATGEQNYELYTRRMDEIAVEFHKRQLEHTDLTATERLSIEADYHEAVKKQNDTANKFTKEQEEERYAIALSHEKQRYIDGKISMEEYNAATELLELEHLRRMTQIFEQGSKEYADANAKYQDKLLKDQQKRQKTAEDEEKKHQQELKQLKKEYFGNNKNENLDLYNKDSANLFLVYQAELKAAENNAEEKLRIDEAYEQAKLALKQKYGLLSAEEETNALQEWMNGTLEWLESDGAEAIVGTMDTLVSGMASIFSGLSTLIQAELEIQTAAIERRYDAEISMAEGNTYKVKKLEEQKEKELAKVKNEANKKLFAMQVIQAVAQTAQNALSAYGSAAAIPLVGYILAPIAAAMAVAAGAVQIAAIKKQQQAAEAQGYMEGGFTPKGRKDEVAGVVHAGEWVASQKLVNSPVTRPIIEALDVAQRNNTLGSLRADDVSRSITAPMVNAYQPQEMKVVYERSEQQQEHADTELSSTIRRLNDRLNEPFVTVNTVTGDHGMLKAQEEYDQLIRNKTPKSRR